MRGGLGGASRNRDEAVKIGCQTRSRVAHRETGRCPAFVPRPARAGCRCAKTWWDEFVNFRLPALVSYSIMQILRRRVSASLPRAVCCASAALVGVVATAGGLAAQPAYDAALARDRVTVAALRVYHPDPARAVVLEGIPLNLVLPRLYRGVVERMLRHSDTFRRQCRRIANAPHVTIVFEGASARRASRHRAHARVVRLPSGDVRVDVAIGQLLDLPELIAHELEHVIEQLDEVDLRDRVTRRGTGVERTDGGAYETSRARRIGQIVALEVRRSTR